MPSPYILYGPHGYQTYPHSRCQEVPTVSVEMSEMQGDWWLQEYVNSHDGKPIGQWSVPRDVSDADVNQVPISRISVPSPDSPSARARAP